MHIAGGTDGLMQLLPQPDNGTVQVPEVLLGLDGAVAQHEHIVADGLDFQIIVK